jgi:hypothetical protein
MNRRPLLPLLALVPLLFACGSKPAPTPDVPAPPTPAGDTGTAASDGGATTAMAPASTAPSGDTTATTPPPAEAGSKKISVKHDPTWATCHSTYKPASKDLAVESGKSAKGCEAATKMKPTGKPEKGTQGDNNPPQTIKLQGRAGKCYRVYAMADAGIKDLDLLLKDSTGAVAAEDSTDDPSPVLVEDGAFCFKEDDAATVVVSVGQGKGSWALTVVSD